MADESYGQGLEREVIAAYKEGHKFLYSKPYLEDALLAISGVQSEDDIKNYKRRIDKIVFRMIDDIGINSKQPKEELAKKFFRYLQQSKRRNFKGKFRLTDAIIARENPSPEIGIGNCACLVAEWAVYGIKASLAGYQNLLLEHNHVVGRIDNGSKFPILADLTVDGAFVQNERGREDYYKFRRYYAGEDMNPDEQTVEDFLKNRFQRAPLERIIPCFINNRACEKMTKDKNQEGAMEDFTKIIEIDPNFSMALVNRGLINFSNMRNKEAERDFLDALALVPYNSNVHVNLGAIYLRKGLFCKEYNEPDEASFWFEKANTLLDKSVELDRLNPDAYYHRRMAREVLGDKNGAQDDLRVYKKCKNHDPCEHQHNDLPEFPMERKRISINIPNICKLDKGRTIHGLKEFYVVHLSKYLYPLRKVFG